MNKNKALSLAITPAVLSWENDNPYSQAFGDHYFAREGGYEESRYVFLGRNDLPQRWKGCERFVIAESGFGTGLNFLTTAEAWLQESDASQTLHYVSFEKHPFRIEDLINIYRHWEHLQPLCNEVLSNYPPLRAGYHRRFLFHDRIVLTFAFGDINDLLPQLSGKVDAWYLDGFAPARNPDMWSEHFFQQVGLHSKRDTTFSTFTAAGFVRRGLQSVGFEVRKFPGFGSKREMLHGQMSQAAVSDIGLPWFRTPDSPFKEKKVIVVGGGIAGVTTALAMAQRGWQVVLLEQKGSVASAASGNPAGLVRPHLTSSFGLWNSLDYSGFNLACDFYPRRQQHDSEQYWYGDGVEVNVTPERAQWIETNLPPEMVSLKSHGEQCRALFKTSGILTPAVFCNAAVNKTENIHLHLQTAVTELRHEDGMWIVATQGGEVFEAETVVIANAEEVSRLLPLHRLGAIAVRGQLTLVEGLGIERAVCGDGYAIPAINGEEVIGASFQVEDDDLTLRASDDDENIKRIEALLGICAEQISVLGARASLRCSTPDHMPTVGPVYDAEFYVGHYSDLRHGRPPQGYPDAKYLPGLYLNIGHGSRGLTTAPLAAQLIADYIEATPQMVGRDVLTQLHSARFMVRRLKKGG